MDNAIKDMKSWDEASRWLAKHGYGVEQISQQEALWKAAQVKPAPNATPKATPKATPAPAPKATVASK